MRRLGFLTLLAVLAWSGVAQAQRPAPGAFTVVTITNTTTDALHVGCAVGSAACTGGIKAGTVAASTIAIGTGGAGLTIASQVPSVTTNALYNNSGNLYFNGVALATGASVSGTANKVSKFTGASTLGNSIITDDGATVTVGGALISNALTAASVTVNGVGIIASTGKIPAISSTYFTSLSGASLTGIPASAITSGNYVATVTGGTNITVSSGTGTASTPSVALTTSPAIAGTLSVAGSGATTNLLHVAGTYTISAAYAASDVAPGLTATAGGNAYVLQLAGGMTSAASGTHSRLSYLDIQPSFTDGGAAVTTWSTADIATVALAADVVKGYGLKVAAPTSATANYAAVFTGGNVGIGTTTPTVPLDVTGAIASSSTITERGRAFAMGATQTRAYSGGNYTTDTGSWTVDSGDITAESWSVVGDTMFFRFNVNTTTIAGTPHTLIIATPAGFTIAETVTEHVGLFSSAGVSSQSVIVTATASGNVTLDNVDGSVFSNAANTVSVRFEIAFKVS